MARRWLAGAVLFVLGFGCSRLVTLRAAGAAATEGVVDGTLEYHDGVEKFALYDPPGGEAEYLVIATRKAAPGTIAAPQITYDTGSTVIAKEDLASLTVFRVEPLIQWQGGVEFCDPDGPVLCPVPPPPGPPLYLHYRFLKSKPL